MVTSVDCDHTVGAYAVAGIPGITRQCRCGQVRIPKPGREENAAYGKACALAVTLAAMLPEGERDALRELLDAAKRETELRVMRRELPALHQIAVRLVELAKGIDAIKATVLEPVGDVTAADVETLDLPRLFRLAALAKQVADLVLRDGKPPDTL